MLVKDRIIDLGDDFTASERKLAAAILADYPFAGLETIQELSGQTRVSAPSISRFVSKLGFQGYLEFKQQLIAELREAQSSPIDLRSAETPIKEGHLKDQMARATAVIEQIVESVTETQFLRACDMLADEKHAVYLIGGRMSDAIGLYLSRHLRLIRKDVFHIPADVEQWPEYLLRMRPRDILVMIDFRRYQPTMETLAERARKRGARILLISDKWISPISYHAAEVLTTQVENGTAWDSYVGALALTEALVVRVSENDWDTTRDRIEAWDKLRPNQPGETDDQ
jgi:DNA-binding MurR/RpiR family transcriptional regulator